MFERRHADRFAIPGAQMRILRNGMTSEVLQVEDMTKSSIRFQIERSVMPGQEIEIELKVPDMDPLILKGHVIWAIDPQGEEKAKAVIQFLPFGTDERYNTIQTYEQLCVITEKYSVITDNPFKNK
jgi:hypothetical protein